MKPAMKADTCFSCVLAAAACLSCNCLAFSVDEVYYLSSNSCVCNHVVMLLATKASCVSSGADASAQVAGILGQTDFKLFKTGWLSTCAGMRISPVHATVIAERSEPDSTSISVSALHLLVDGWPYPAFKPGSLSLSMCNLHKA